MAQDANHLVWLDMEMTGLDPERERIIELAMIVTDQQSGEHRRITGMGHVHQPDTRCLTPWMTGTRATHGKLRPDRQDQVPRQWMKQPLKWPLWPSCRQYTCRRAPARCAAIRSGRTGVSWCVTCQSSKTWFHYRNLDVSTLKELCKRWKPEVAKGFIKKAEHTALADIRESIEELKYYREHFIKL